MSPTVPELAPAPGLRSTAAAPPEEALVRHCLALVAEDLEAAETELHRLLHSTLSIIPEVGGHLAFAGGKRFRPLLTLLCARAAGYTDPCRFVIAAVGELLHTATLLHDDVTDEGEWRRGRPAARMAYGNGLSVLTGDYCLARALQAVARTGKLVAVRSMSDAVTRMAEGEVAQLHAAGDASLDRERYLDVIERKTAALIAWCSAVGGLVAEPYQEALHTFGLELGYAFQVADDLLDYAVGDHAVTGKLPGRDLLEGKMTLPLIMACEQQPELHAEVMALLESGPPMSSARAQAIVETVLASGAMERAQEFAFERAAAATRALEALPPSPALDALRSVAHYTVRRRL